MQCKLCKSQASCTDSREAHYCRWRRYRCECGNKFTTFEVLEDQIEFSEFGKRSGLYKWWQKTIKIAVYRAKMTAKQEVLDELGLNKDETTAT